MRCCALVMVLTYRRLYLPNLNRCFCIFGKHLDYRGVLDKEVVDVIVVDYASRGLLSHCRLTSLLNSVEKRLMNPFQVQLQSLHICLVLKGLFSLLQDVLLILGH